MCVLNSRTRYLSTRIRSCQRQPIRCAYPDRLLRVYRIVLPSSGRLRHKWEREGFVAIAVWNCSTNSWLALYPTVTLIKQSGGLAKRESFSRIVFANLARRTIEIQNEPPLLSYNSHFVSLRVEIVLSGKREKICRSAVSNIPDAARWRRSSSSATFCRNRNEMDQTPQENRARDLRILNAISRRDTVRRSRRDATAVPDAGQGGFLRV